MKIIIIGATSGIGRALFRFYADEGNIVGAVDRRTHLLEELQQQYPENTHIATADITKQDETEQAIQKLRKGLGNIDLAIICSGTGELNPMLDDAKESPTINTNVVGWTFCVDTFYNIFRQQGYGHLVAITSVGGLRGGHIAPAYNASKAYQINYMEALRAKAFKDGRKINVTDIRPGLVDTAMAKGEGLFWVMPVDKVAKQIINAIKCNKSKAYVTKRWHILAVINKLIPFCIFKRM